MEMELHFCLLVSAIRATDVREWSPGLGMGLEMGKGKGQEWVSFAFDVPLSRVEMRSCSLR